VAWVAELKNTLSAVFYLTALIVYVHFDTDRRWRWYLMALARFVLGLLTKTVVATLPGALLVLLWWRRGRLVWKQDVLPLVPFFALAAASGLLTAWIELKLIGATGDDFAFTLIERGLIAGRVIWFYLGKLIWPADLIFFYPRWTVDQTAGWQYLFPLGVLAGLVFLWRMRHRSRGPLAALLLFVGTLAPVLGFLNVYPFKFSFVADHFQYLASIWIIAAVAVGIDRLLPLRNPPRRGAPLTLVIYLALPAALGAMAWKQSWNYRNEEVLYRAVLEKNPRCWIAWNNLGDESVSANRRDEAIRYFEAALQIKPDYVDALINLGNALAEKQNWELATTRLQQALRFEPNSVEAHFGLGNIQYYTGHMQAAAELYRQTLQIKPDHDKALYNLGCALLQLDRPATAKPYFERALRLDPDKAGAHSGLGIALLRADRLDDATQQFQAALRIKPDDIGMRLNLAFTLNKAGRAQEAIAAYRAVLKLDPGNQPARENLAPLLGQNLPLNPGR
jgi:tetratricopeptide (TPR) repeat protein